MTSSRWIPSILVLQRQKPAADIPGVFDMVEGSVCSFHSGAGLRESIISVFHMYFTRAPFVFTLLLICTMYYINQFASQLKRPATTRLIILEIVKVVTRIRKHGRRKLAAEMLGNPN